MSCILCACKPKSFGLANFIADSFAAKWPKSSQYWLATAIGNIHTSDAINILKELMTIKAQPNIGGRRWTTSEVVTSNPPTGAAQCRVVPVPSSFVEKRCEILRIG